jgi:hypothetical protein
LSVLIHMVAVRAKDANVATPHDKVFRRVLGEPAQAASQLRAILPPALLKHLDLDQLALVSGSFVDTDLKVRYADLLFTAPLVGSQPAYVHLHFEHQSTPDPWMALRMLEYMISIWQRHRRAHPKDRRLPAVIPIVVYYGQRPWNAATDVVDLLDLPEDAAQAAWEYLPHARFLLDDLTGVDDQALRARPVTAPTRTLLYVLRVALDNPHLLEDLRAWEDQLRAVLEEPAGGREMFVAILSYIQAVGNVPADQLRDLIATLGPEAEEAYMTTADMLRAEGRVEGRAETLAENVAEVRETLLTGLATRGLTVTDDARELIDGCESHNQFMKWMLRLLSGDYTSLEDLLRP